MINVQTFHEHGVLRCHHIVIVILREMHPQPVRRLARFAMPNIVRKNDEEFLYIERLPRAKQNIRKYRVQQRMRVAARAVQQQNGIIRVAGGVVVRLAES